MGSGDNRRLHIAAAVLHFLVICGLFAAIGFRSDFMLEGRLPVACVTMDATPETRGFSDLVVDNNCTTYDIIAVCIFMHVWTCLYHVIYSKRGTAGKSRWDEYTVSAPLVFVNFALTSGTRDLTTLVLIGTSIAAIMRTGVFSGPTEDMTGEDKNRIAVLQTEKIRLTFLGWLSMTAVFVIILWNYGRVGDAAPWFVHVIVGCQCVLLPSFGVLALYQLAGKVSETRADAVYAILSMTSKIVPTSIFIGAISNP